MKTKSLLLVLIAFFMMQYTNAAIDGNGTHSEGAWWYTTSAYTDGSYYELQDGWSVDKPHLDINLAYPSDNVAFQVWNQSASTANRNFIVDQFVNGSWSNVYNQENSSNNSWNGKNTNISNKATQIAIYHGGGNLGRRVRNVKIRMAAHTILNTKSLDFQSVPVPVGKSETKTIDFYSFLANTSSGMQVSIVDASGNATSLDGQVTMKMGSYSGTSFTVKASTFEKIGSNTNSIQLTFSPNKIQTNANCTIKIVNSTWDTQYIPIKLSSSLNPPTLSLQSNGTGYEVVYLQWNAIDGAQKYNLYDNGTKIGTYTGTTATITGLTMGSNHKYTVTSIYGTAESKHSNTIDVTTYSYPKTSSVTFSNVQQNQFTINWGKVDIKGKDHKFNRYQIHVYYYDYYGNWVHLQNIYITDNNQTSYTVTGIDDATKYDVYVGVDFQYTVNGTTKSFDVASIGTQWVNNNVTTKDCSVTYIDDVYNGVKIYKGEWHYVNIGTANKLNWLSDNTSTVLRWPLYYPCETLQYRAWVESNGNLDHSIKDNATGNQYFLCGKNDGRPAYLEGNKLQTPATSISTSLTDIQFERIGENLFATQTVYVSDAYAKIARHIKLKNEYHYINLGSILLNKGTLSAKIEFESFLVDGALTASSNNNHFKLSKTTLAPAATTKAGTFCQKGNTSYDFTVTFTASEAGKHVAVITISDGKQSTIVTIEAEVLTMNIFETAGDWNNSNNWKVKVLPASNEDVEINAAANIPNGYTATVKDITLSNGGSITIAPQGKLKANNITGANATNLTLQANESGTATLLFKNTNKVDATIQLYTLASSDGLRNETPGNFKDPKWQYFGINVESLAYSTLNNDGISNWIYRWDETKHTSSCWAEKLKTGSNLSAWTGYGIAQEKDTTYTYSGTLINSDHTYNLTYTDGTNTNGDRGNNLITNSYTAPIDITTLSNSNFTNAVANIIIYNTGSYAEWRNQTNISGFNPGQVIEIPVNTVNSLSANYPRTIASSQAFFVTANSGGGSFSVNYDKNVYNATQTSNVKRAKNNSKNFENVLCITVANSTSTDQLHLLEHNATTPEFDNGYDAKKHFDNPTGMQIYATTAFGHASINTNSTFNGQNIGFIADSEYELYTMTFDIEQISSYNELYLYDAMTETYVDILTEEEYQFYGSVEPMDNRFIITTERKNAASDNTTTSVESVTWDDIVAMNETIYLYTTTGQLISTLSTNSIENLSIPAGIYIVRCGDKTLKIVNR